MPPTRLGIDETTTTGWRERGFFSVGADGLLIDGGQLGAPVREVTIASTLQRLLLDVVEVGGDFEWTPGGSGACSLVIDDVAVSGS